MAIFKYTLFKYIKSWSTWLVILLSFFIVIFFGGYLPASTFDFENTISSQDYIFKIIKVISYLTSVLIGLIAIFAGFKASTMLRDEIENDVFLIILSKPIKRSRIIWNKLMALVTMLFFYALILTIAFVIAIFIFDKSQIKQYIFDDIPFNSLKTKIWAIGAILWMILFLIALFFSAIAVLLATKLSVSATIGAAISLAVFIPATNLISVFSEKATHEGITRSKNTLFHLNNQENDALFDALDIDDQSIDFRGKDDLITLYNVGFDTKISNNYEIGWLFDLNFHFNTLTSIILMPCFSKQLESAIELDNFGNKMGHTANNLLIKPTEKQPWDNDIDQRKILDNLINNSWAVLAPLRNSYIAHFNTIFSHVRSNLAISLPKKMENILQALEIEAKNSFTKKTMNEIINFNYQKKDVQTQANYYQLLSIFADFYKDNQKSFGFEVNQEITNFFGEKPLREDFWKLFKIVLSPMQWFNDYNIDTFIMNHGIAVNNTLLPQNPETSVPLTLINANIENDIYLYACVASIIEQDYQLFKLTTDTYTSKFTILYVYLTITVILIFIAALVVKNQDIS